MAAVKNQDGKPQILGVVPNAAIPGGELHVHGKGFVGADRPRVKLGDTAAPLVVGSDSFLVARVPDGVAEGEIVVFNGRHNSSPWVCDLGLQIAEGIHAVANPAVDAEGCIFTTLSGQRGQKTPVSVYKIDANYHRRAFLSDLMNATGLAFDREGLLYASSRQEGIVYQVTPRGTISVYVEGMGVATGLAFDGDENLYVGDRSGTIFKVSRGRQIYVFATIEPSIAAYHLAFGPDGHLYVTGPTTSSYECVHRVSPAGEVSVFYRGLGRPQGMAFDREGRLYVGASLGGRRGVVRITPDGGAELFLSGPSIVGMAFTPSSAMIVATNHALYRVEVGVRGLPLPNR
ncbi:MAG: IPT/TIG domain-containing protein [Bryobacteraceae bacterium]